MAGRLSGDRTLALALAAASAAMGVRLVLAGWLVSVPAVVLAWLLGPRSARRRPAQPGSAPAQ